MPLIRSSEPVADGVVTAPAILDRAQLAHDLRSDDAAKRRDAVRLAGRQRAADLLAERLEAESDEGIREAIFTGLIRIGGAEAARPLLPLLRNEDALLRNAAIETLQSMGDDIVPEIEMLLDDPDSDIRIFAVNIVHSLRSPRAPDIALKVIEADTHVNVCAAAVDVLAEIGRPDMADALRAVAIRFPDQPFLAFAVRAALKRIG